MSKAPGVMANGPSQSNRDTQVWERPWSLEEMRQSSATWSLAADSGLFLFLQDFSHRMLSKTHEMEKQLDGLIRDTKAADACLHSVFNDFLMLSNTQFIENRVYDEEIEDPGPKAEALDKQAEPERTREQKEAELIPKMQEAVTYGLKVLDSAFEQLDIKAGNSDSEDDDTADRVDAILEPKDLYVDRPLPYLIGSQAFMEQDDVGLGDLSSDEMSMDSDRDSVMESEDEKDESEEEFEQEANGSIKKKSSMVSYGDDEDEEDEDSDIFGESDKDDDDDEEDGQKSLCHIQNAGHQATFADELAARIKGDPVCKAEADRTSLTSKKKSKSKKDQKPPRAAAAVEDDSDDMFKPPKMEDDDFSPFGGRGGLFSGGRGLFDDDDEGDLFSDAPKPARSEEKAQTSTHTTDAAKPGKKIPSGGISIFPENSASKNESESAESKENGTAVKPRTPSAHKPVSGGGGGLFDDDEEEDDFFSGKKSTKTSNSAGQDRPKAKKTVDLFGGDEDEDDEDEGDIFSEKSSAPPPAVQSTKVVEEQNRAPEKKMPAGAISMFGPGTKNLLSEGLKKRQPSTSDDSDKSDENGPPPDVDRVPSTQTQKPATRGLFSDDEDSQIFPSIPKSRSQPEPTSQGRTSKAPLSLFDDEEEEDLFASSAKSKPKVNQAKATTPQPKKTAPSSLFSDDEDQWLNSKAGAETKTGGMKSSVSAPSSFPAAITSRKGSLFDDNEDDDLFATTKVSSQKKHQRVALLFEDEADDDDESKGSLFGSKPAAAPAPKSSAAAPPTPAPPSLFDSEPPEEVSSVPTTALQSPEAQPPPTPPGGLSESRKKPPGAVSLFGGIDVLASKLPKKSPSSDEPDTSFLSGGGDGPPPTATDGRAAPPSPAAKEEKKAGKTNAVSLFDQEEEQDEDSEGSAPTQPAAKKNTLKAAAETTGVFQDEELLFSRTQQKDNDPGVDLFTTSGKAVSTKTAAPSLFADDDDDDLFTSIKPKAPPKVAEKPSKPKDDAPLKPATPAPEPQKPASAEPEPLKATSPASVPENEKPAASPVKSKEPSSRIGKLQANLVINPAALLPGAVPRIPGAVGVLPGPGTGSSSGVSSSSLTPSPTTPVRTQTDGGDGGVSFESPVQVAALQSANKGRAKGSVRRRPQSRAARQQAVQTSGEDGPQQEAPPDEDRRVPSSRSPALSPIALSLPVQTGHNNDHPALPDSVLSSSQPPVPPGRPSVLTLPVSTNPGQKPSPAGSGDHKATPPPPDPDDLFASDGGGGGALFGSKSAARRAMPPSQTAVAKTPAAQQERERSKRDETSALPSLFDDHSKDDLFQKVKPRSTAKKAKAPSSFLEEDDDDGDGNIFGTNKSSTPAVHKEAKSLSKPDIFQDEVTSMPKAPKKQTVQSLDAGLFDKKHTVDASLFDDNVDIFADLTSTTKPKDKSKKKMETKSIFDDDMDDIFSVKPSTKAPSKSKKTPTSQDTSAAEDTGNIFDDPLNALGGN